MLRVSRAALYGAGTGAIVAAIGHWRTPNVPAGFDGWIYIAGGWAGCVCFGMALFVAVAAISNMIVDLR